MRIAVVHPQTPFVRGGAEIHTEAVVRALAAAGHETEQLVVAGKWYPAAELVHQMGVWRSLDLSKVNGGPIDLVIALKFPAYLVRHPRKVVWLIHQHRDAYELWGHPEFGSLFREDDGPTVRDLIRASDRIAMGEAHRVFTNSRNVQQRLRRSLDVPSDVLYHRSPLADALLDAEPGPYGDELVYPSRLEGLKRQRLVVDAMRHVTGGVRLTLVGDGPDEPALRARIGELGLTERVTLAGRISDDELRRRFLGALAVYYGPFDEDYGYVTLEAFAAGRPVVTLADAGGPLEFVRDGETGLVVPPEPEAIAHAFDRLAVDRGAAARMGRAGHELLRRTVPGWPEIVERLTG